MKFVKQMLKNIVFGKKASSKRYVKYLKSIGVKIGEGTVFHNAISTKIDEQYPFLIEIGSNCHFANDFTIYTHDFSWCVSTNLDGQLLGAAGNVKIGNNVFCGKGVTILRGVTIGDNCIIGSESLVTKNIPSNQVWGGNPAHFICTLEKYIEKRKKSQLEEASNLFISYYQTYNKIPPEKTFYEFFWLFESKSKTNNESFISQINVFEKNGISINEKKENQLFSSYNDFVEFCLKKIENKT